MKHAWTSTIQVGTGGNKAKGTHGRDKTWKVQATRRTLPVLVSRTARATADTRAFEVLAGRSAMVGCVVAGLLETADAMKGREHEFVNAAYEASQPFETYGASAVVLLCLGACVAGGGLAALFAKQRNATMQVEGETPSPQDIAEAATKAIEALATKRKAKNHA